VDEEGFHWNRSFFDNPQEFRGKIALVTELDIVFIMLYLIHVKNQYTERYITTDE
jgi:hypothetical protein